VQLIFPLVVDVFVPIFVGEEKPSLASDNCAVKTLPPVKNPVAV